MSKSKSGATRSGNRHTRQASAKPAAVRHFELLRKALAWILEECCLQSVVLHGNSTYQPLQLIQLAILWAWSENAQLSQAYKLARQTANQMFGDLPLASYTGFIRALATCSQRLSPILRDHLQKLMVSVGGDLVRIGQYFVLVVDGSRGQTPRTKSNEQAFSASSYGKSNRSRTRQRWKNKRRRTRKAIKGTIPQYWLTKLWHMGLKMPWAWKIGPSNSSERGHLQELLKSCFIPEKTLIVADAGFVGYDLLRSIHQAGHDFMVRVGANVYLLKHLGKVRARGDLVHIWPASRMRAGEPPLTLRLMTMQGPRGRIHVVTSVLDRMQLSEKQAAVLYRLRWGVELQFRNLKQTFGRGKLRSRNGDNAVVELEWSIFALWIIQLYAVKEQLEIDSPPERCSVAHALRIFRELLRDPNRVVTSYKVLVNDLQKAVIDDYTRLKSKRCRHPGYYADLPTTDPPKIKKATKKQKQRFRELDGSKKAESVTA
jgi:hypothetical protein